MRRRRDHIGSSHPHVGFVLMKHETVHLLIAFMNSPMERHQHSCNWTSSNPIQFRLFSFAKTFVYHLILPPRSHFLLGRPRLTQRPFASPSPVRWFDGAFLFRGTPAFAAVRCRLPRRSCLPRSRPLPSVPSFLCFPFHSPSFDPRVFLHQMVLFHRPGKSQSVR